MGEISHFDFHFFFHFSGLNEGRIVIWTPLAKEKTRILSRHSHRVDWLSFSPDGRFLASEDMNGRLIIWSTEVNKQKTEKSRSGYQTILNIFNVISELATRLHRRWSKNMAQKFLVVVFVYGCPWLQTDIPKQWPGIYNRYMNTYTHDGEV